MALINLERKNENEEDFHVFSSIVPSELDWGAEIGEMTDQFDRLSIAAEEIMGENNSSVAEENIEMISASSSVLSLDLKLPVPENLEQVNNNNHGISATACNLDLEDKEEELLEEEEESSASNDKEQQLDTNNLSFSAEDLSSISSSTDDDIEVPLENGKEDWGHLFLLELKNENSDDESDSYESDCSETEVEELDYAFFEEALKQFREIFMKNKKVVLRTHNLFFLHKPNSDYLLENKKTDEMKDEETNCDNEEEDNSDADTVCDNDSGSEENVPDFASTSSGTENLFPESDSTFNQILDEKSFTKMKEWYIHNSVPDLLHNICANGLFDIPLSVECLLDLPIENDEWPYFRDKVYEIVMNIDRVSLSTQVKFWSALISVRMNSPQYKLAARLKSDLCNHLEMIFKGTSKADLIEEQMLIDEMNLKEMGGNNGNFASVFDDEYTSLYVFSTARISRFLMELVPRGLMPTRKFIDYLLYATNRFDDKGFVLLVACVYHFIHNQNLLHVDSTFLTPLSSEQQAVLQVYAKLALTICDDEFQSSLPQSFITFTKHLIYHQLINIFKQWHRMGVAVMQNGGPIPSVSANPTKSNCLDQYYINEQGAVYRLDEDAKNGRKSDVSPKYIRATTFSSRGIGFTSTTSCLLKTALIDKFFNWMRNIYTEKYCLNLKKEVSSDLETDQESGEDQGETSTSF